MILVKVPNEGGIQNPIAGNPGTLLRPVPLLIDEVLVSPTATPHVQETMDRLRRVIVYDPGRRWERKRWGDNGLVETGLIWETWKVGSTRRDGGSRRRTAQGLIILSISKGPMKRGESLGGSPSREDPLPGAKPFVWERTEGQAGDVYSPVF